MAPIHHEVCPLFDASDIPYCECLASDKGCSIELAIVYKQCPLYKRIKEAMKDV
ncbi:unnamed protein product [marine sediment metagenome]|uniref:Uncharacterized protein n=1 Tax=marine sediment metagenome TaxID=412755 RepID=X1U9F3_9ZZZZ